MYEFRPRPDILNDQKLRIQNQRHSLIQMKEEHAYTPLATDTTADFDDTSTPGGRCSPWRQHVRPILLAALFIIALFSAGLIVARKLSFESGGTAIHWLECGRTPEAARANGCVFDMMMNGWTRSECYNRELSEEYIEKYPFRFFADRFGFEELTMEEVRKGEHNILYSTENHHYIHCAFVWELQGLALAGGKYIDEHSMNYDHTRHCTNLLVRTHELQAEPWIGNGTKVPQTVEIGYIRCRALR